MGRIRSLKPEFGHHDKLSALSAEVHLFAALLLTYADDEGYFQAHPKLLHAAVCPLRELIMSVPEILGELRDIGYVELFNGTDDREYGRVANFSIHQRVAHPTPSKIKPLMKPHEILGSSHESGRPDLGTGNREQGSRNREEPTVTEESFTLDAAVSFALVETGLAGKGIRDVIHQVIARDIKKLSVDPKSTAEAMIEAWRKYDPMELPFKLGPEKFFGTGTWRKPEKEWRGNQGGPTAISASYVPESEKRRKEQAERKAQGW